uniref:Uncharacterized protein n=1 Tax=Panagrellus redivivus TaxID=6233 RepID=A0A7E4ZRK0_PANRE
MKRASNTYGGSQGFGFRRCLRPRRTRMTPLLTSNISASSSGQSFSNSQTQRFFKNCQKSMKSRWITLNVLSMKAFLQSCLTFGLFRIALFPALALLLPGTSISSGHRSQSRP